MELTPYHLIHRNEDRGELDILDNDQVIEVIQWEIGCIWTNGKSMNDGSLRYIESKWASTCIIITSYNKETGKTCLAHIDALHSIFHTLGRMGRSDIRIIWWWNQEIINEAIEAAKVLWMNIVEIDWPTHWGSRSVIIDSQTGFVYNTFSAWTRPRVAKILDNPYLTTNIIMWAQLSLVQTGEKPPCQWVFNRD